MGWGLPGLCSQSGLRLNLSSNHRASCVTVRTLPALAWSPGGLHRMGVVGGEAL